MAKVNSRNGQLFFDFRYLGVRCREYTKLPDDAKSRKLAAKLGMLCTNAVSAGDSCG